MSVKAKYNVTCTYLNFANITVDVINIISAFLRGKKSQMCV